MLLSSKDDENKSKPMGTNHIVLTSPLITPTADNHLLKPSPGHVWFEVLLFSTTL